MNKQCLRKRTGAVMTFVAIGLLVMLGMFALVVDAGLLFAERSRLVNAVDAGALAGVTALPDDQATATLRAKVFVQRNDPDVADSDIIVGFANTPSGTTTIVNGRINVTATKNVPLMFAKFLGFETAPVSATASAGLKYFGSGSGVVPFGVTEETVSGMTAGERYILKFGPQLPTDEDISTLGYPVGPFRGNFGALAIGGSGASVYRDNIMYGSSTTLSVGDVISTEPGVMSGPTDTAVDYRIGLDPSATYATVVDTSPRVVIVPIIDPGVGDISGRTDVTIKGFAAFFLEEFTGKGQTGFVIGSFIERKVVSGVPGGGGSVDYGIYTYSLVN